MPEYQSKIAQWLIKYMKNKKQSLLPIRFPIKRRIMNLVSQQETTTYVHLPAKSQVNVLQLPGCIIFIQKSILKRLANAKSLTELQRNMEIGLTFYPKPKKKPLTSVKKK